MAMIMRVFIIVLVNVIMVFATLPRFSSLFTIVFFFGKGQGSDRDRGRGQGRCRGSGDVHGFRMFAAVAVAMAMSTTATLAQVVRLKIMASVVRSFGTLGQRHYASTLGDPSSDGVQCRFAMRRKVSVS